MEDQIVIRLQTAIASPIHQYPPVAQRRDGEIVELWKMLNGRRFERIGDGQEQDAVRLQHAIQRLEYRCRRTGHMLEHFARDDEVELALHRRVGSCNIEHRRRVIVGVRVAELFGEWRSEVVEIAHADRGPGADDREIGERHLSSEQFVGD